jgi:hypothetical protein
MGVNLSDAATDRRARTTHTGGALHWALLARKGVRRLQTVLGER